jgi:hypothetical protein
MVSALKHCIMATKFQVYVYKLPKEPFFINLLVYTIILKLLMPISLFP